MPPKLKEEIQQKPVSKSFHFLLQSDAEVRLPWSRVSEIVDSRQLVPAKSGANAKGKGSQTETTPDNEENPYQNLHLYMLIDFQSADGESTPLYPVPVKRIDSQTLLQSCENAKKDGFLTVASFSTRDPSLPNAGSSLLELKLPSEETLLELLDSKVVAYLVACQELIHSEADLNAKKKPTSQKGKLDPEVLSRQRLESFLADNKALYICEYNLGKGFLMSFAFNIRSELMIESVFVPPTEKKKDSKKDEAETISPNESVSCKFTASLHNSPGGLLSDLESGPYYFRLYIEKVDDLPSDEYAEFQSQIKPSFVNIHIKGEAITTSSLEQSKALKFKHEVVYRIEKENIEDWRNFFEEEKIQFCIRDRELKFLPLPKPVETESDVEGTADGDNPDSESDAPKQEFYPKQIAQPFGYTEMNLRSLAGGKAKCLREDIPIQSRYEMIDIPLPPPPEPETPVVEAKKGKSTAPQKGKPILAPTEDPPAPKVDYTEDPILVKSGQYVQKGSFIRVLAQLSKPLPPPEERNRISHVVIAAKTKEHKEIIQEVSDFVLQYTPETEVREVQQTATQIKNPKQRELEAQPATEVVPVKEDFIDVVSIISPQMTYMILEGLKLRGMRTLSQVLQEIKNRCNDVKILSNPSISSAKRKYTELNEEAPDNTVSSDSEIRKSNHYCLRLSDTPMNLQMLSKEKSVVNLLEKLIDFSNASTLSQVYEGSLWPTTDDLQALQKLFGLDTNDFLEEEIIEEESIPEIFEGAADEEIQLKDSLGQFVSIVGVPLVFPPDNLPPASHISTEGEQSRWDVRRQQSNPGEEDDNLLEDKLWVFARDFSQHIIIAIQPTEVVVPDLNRGIDILTYQDSPLPSYNIASTFSGVLEATSVEDVYCLVVHSWSQNSGKKIDNKLNAKYIPKSKKYTKDHFVAMNKRELEKQSELIKKKRLIEERIEESKLHPLIREAREKIREASKNNPVYLYSGQRNRWSELQQKAMREAMKQSNKKQNYSFTKSDFLSLSFSAVTAEEEEKAKQFRTSEPVQNKASFKYPAPREPGSWTKPDVELHPSKIEELRTTVYFESNTTRATLSSKDGKLRKKPFLRPNPIGKDFSSISQLDNSESAIGVQREKELRKQKEHEEWKRKLVVDDPAFHVTSKKSNHPLDKRNTLLQSAPKKLYLKKNPVQSETQSIHASDPYEDVSKRPFQQVLQVVQSRTHLPVSLGKGENVDSFYVAGKKDAPLSKAVHTTRPIKPVSSSEKSGHLWGGSV